jgi:phenylalanyl-tRNA synthetase beta chain
MIFVISIQMTCVFLNSLIISKIKGVTHMKVSYQWLAEYVNLEGYTAADLAEKLTRSGIEVDVVENRNKGVEQVIVGYVQTREKHPDADKLNVCTVDVGQAEHLQIVCGAPNVDAGQKVPVAVVGAVLPGDFKIKKAKLRGVESHGMICSAKELGLNDRLLPKEIQEGILVLPENLKIGENILDVMGMRDEIMELDLTPNRSDCLSMIGVAYEIAAIIGRVVKLPAADEQVHLTKTRASDRIQVKINAADYCDHYAVRLIEGIRITASPLWLQNRLMAAGIRPINNIVDITNYVMLEYGQPLHAFDADQLEGQIDVRLAKPGEKMVTLDDVERTLDPEMLLITDGVKPIAIAGVMGGANSEVTQKTTRILLESARFAGGSVRKTSRQLGLRSEASLRFEKEVNPQAVIPALNRAAAFIAKYDEGEVAEGIVEDVINTTNETTIPLSVDKVNQYLGTHISMLEMKEIFSRLNFDYEETTADQSLWVRVPSRRGDITRDVDLIEEVARLYGYDLIPTTLMSGVTTPGSLNRQQVIRRAVRSLLTQSGLNEVVNYSFTHPDKIRSFPGLFVEAEPIALSMPMSEERAVLRTSLIPHLLDDAMYNRNRNQEDIAIFEIGSVFVTNEQRITKLPEEKMLLSVLLTGERNAAHWSAKKSLVDFYDLKGIVERLIEYLGIQDIKFIPVQKNGFHPGRTASLMLSSEAGEIQVGYMGQLHPTLQQEMDLDDTYIMELELEPLYNHATFNIAYRALPRFPAIARDIAVVVAEDIHAGDLAGSVKAVAGSLLESVEVFDVFVGERLGAGKKSIALSLVYRHPERTLTDEEVSELHTSVVKELEVAFAAELRK